MAEREDAPCFVNERAYAEITIGGPSVEQDGSDDDRGKLKDRDRERGKIRIQSFSSQRRGKVRRPDRLAAELADERD